MTAPLCSLVPAVIGGGTLNLAYFELSGKYC